jgi:hypothetical protein
METTPANAGFYSVVKDLGRGERLIGEEPPAQVLLDIGEQHPTLI